MASSSHRGGAAAYRSREGLSTRSGTNTDEIQSRISGLHSQVRMLRNQMMLIKAQVAGVKNNVRKLNKSIQQARNSRHVMHVVAFTLVLFFIFHLLLSKM